MATNADRVTNTKTNTSIITQRNIEEVEFEHKDVPSIISIGQSVELADILTNTNTAKMKWNRTMKKRSIRAFFVSDPIRKHFRAFSCKESKQT